MEQCMSGYVIVFAAQVVEAGAPTISLSSDVSSVKLCKCSLMRGATFISSDIVCKKWLTFSNFYMIIIIKTISKLMTSLSFSRPQMFVTVLRFRKKYFCPNLEETFGVTK